MSSVVRSLGHFGLWLAAATAATVGAGSVYAAIDGKAVGGGITDALFIVGGVLFVGAAVTGGGTRGRLADARQGIATPDLPFTGALVGLGLIGLGVLAAVL